MGAGRVKKVLHNVVFLDNGMQMIIKAEIKILIARMYFDFTMVSEKVEKVMPQVFIICYINTPA